MKKRIFAAAAALLMLASQSVCAAADWGYDDTAQYGDQTWTDNTWTDNTWTDNTWTDNTWTDNTWTDNTWTDETQTGDESGSDSSSTDDSHADSANNIPVNVILEQSPIVDKKFTLDLKFSTQSKVTGADLTVLYDPAVLKMTGAVANKKAAKKPGKGVAAETEPGVIQYQFNDPEGSEWKESFLTMSFEVVDALQKSSAIYIKVNSILDEYSTLLSYRADGTIVQIAGAVEYDAKDDESMYTELRVAKSDKPVSLESLGFQNVASVQFEDKKLASSDNKSITTLGYGLTNMTVEFTDGSKKYFRLVVSQAAPADVTTAAGVVGSPDQAAPSAQTASGTDAADKAAVQPEASEQPEGLTKTETHNKSKVKYLVIYILVLVALIAIIVEFFVFYGNPYAKTAAILRKRKEGADEGYPYEGEGFNGESLDIPDRSGGYPAYGNDSYGFEDSEGYEGEGYSDEKYAYEDGEGYSDGEEFGYEGEDGYETEDGYADADEGSDGFAYEEEEGAGDGYEYSDDDEDDYYEDDDDAYDGYEDSDDGYVIDPTRTEHYDGQDNSGAFSDSDDDTEYVSDDDILGDDEESDFEGDLKENKDTIDLSSDDEDQ